MSVDLSDLKVRDVVNVMDNGNVSWLRHAYYIVRQQADFSQGADPTIRLLHIGSYNSSWSGYICVSNATVVLEVVGRYVGLLSNNASHLDTNFFNVHWTNKSCGCCACRTLRQDTGPIPQYDSYTDIAQRDLLVEKLRGGAEEKEQQEKQQEEQSSLLARGTCPCANPMCTGPHSFFHQA